MESLRDGLGAAVGDWMRDAWGVDLNQPAFVYVLLVIPLLLAATVTLQGLGKMMRRQAGGCLIVIFGLLFFSLVAGVYVFFVR